jgi:hypothetical protein
MSILYSIILFSIIFFTIYHSYILSDNSFDIEIGTILFLFPIYSILFLLIGYLIEILFF